ncbi:MAG: HU family DNA-binding protein [Candidatus Xenobium sp.]|jgi:DNA-binding protein HU-beta
MPGTQKEFADRIAAELGLSGRTGRRFVRRFVQLVAEEIVESGRVELRGLGTFATVPRPPQTIRHPKTGEPIEVPAYRTVRFRASKRIREALLKQEPRKRRKPVATRQRTATSLEPTTNSKA